MRVFWWQDGLRISAESEEEHQFLARCWDALQTFEVRVGEEVPGFPVNKVQTDDE